MAPENAPAWATIDDKYPFNCCVEQFLLAACLDFHREHPASLYRGVRPWYVFSSLGEAYDINRAARAGFTHLLGDAKSHPAIAKRLEERVRREKPAYLKRCHQVASRVHLG